jgi:hypothetical protein
MTQNMTQARARYLYVMRSRTGLIKIGRSLSPKRRRRELECVSGLSIMLIAAIRGRGADERLLHAALREWRTNGEWFEDRAEVRRFLERHFDQTFSWGRSLPEPARRNETTREVVREAVRRIMGGEPPPEWDELHDLEEQLVDQGWTDVAAVADLNERRIKAGMGSLGPARESRLSRLRRRRAEESALHPPKQPHPNGTEDDAPQQSEDVRKGGE